MRKGIAIIRAGTDYHEWSLGWQLEVDGRLAPMFDLHKSKIIEVGGFGSDGFERLLEDSANGLLVQFGVAAHAGVPLVASH